MSHVLSFFTLQMKSVTVSLSWPTKSFKIMMIGYTHNAKTVKSPKHPRATTTYSPETPSWVETDPPAPQPNSQTRDGKSIGRFRASEGGSPKVCHWVYE
jgi:hypothetical protein